MASVTENLGGGTSRSVVIIGGGVPPAAQDGRGVIRNLCHADGRQFVATAA